MTYKELKEALEKLTEERLNEQVYLFDTDEGTELELREIEDDANLVVGLAE